jgi:hypothetical protein
MNKMVDGTSMRGKVQPIGLVKECERENVMLLK